MMKYFSFCLVMTMFCLSVPLMGQEVEISIDHPDQVKAGQEFTVTVTINKGRLSDYSRFSQDLPLGLTATNVSSPNADFSFDNQRIRIIWLKLPSSGEVKVSYNIHVNERLKGSFILGGVFAYVVEDVRKFLNFEQSREISITPNSSIDPSLIVDIKNFKGASDVVPTSTPKPETFAMAVRQKPLLQGSGAYLVHLLINNPPGSKYAKIEETIPSGYLFEEVSSQDGIVSYAANTVKFIWMTLPESPEFEVVYRLVPKQNEPQGNMAIEGLFTYTSGNENKLVEVKEMDISIEDLSGVQKRNLLSSGNIPGGVRTSPTTVQQQTETTAQQQTERRPTTVSTEPKPTPAVLKSDPAGASDNSIANTRVLSTGSGIYFRVQVAANQNAYDARSFFRDEGLAEEVLVEKHEGWYKYTAGSFQTYAQAVVFRDRVERISSIVGPFVVAYQDGNRVPIGSVMQ